MNKQKIDQLIPQAYDALAESGIANNNGIINSTYRGQISTFGAAVMNGTLLSAICFFSESGKSSVDRSKLLKAIKMLIPGAADYKNLFTYAADRKNKQAKENILNATVALKLAMSLYELKAEDGKGGSGN